jgi:hypothetical protein
MISGINLHDLSAVLRQQRKSDVMTSFGLSARSAVYYKAGYPLHWINVRCSSSCVLRAGGGDTFIHHPKATASRTTTHSPHKTLKQGIMSCVPSGECRRAKKWFIALLFNLKLCPQTNKIGFCVIAWIVLVIYWCDHGCDICPSMHGQISSLYLNSSWRLQYGTISSYLWDQNESPLRLNWKFRLNGSFFKNNSKLLLIFASGMKNMIINPSRLSTLWCRS